MVTSKRPEGPPELAEDVIDGWREAGGEMIDLLTKRTRSAGSACSVPAPPLPSLRYPNIWPKALIASAGQK
jgi:hypothetical protein